MNRFSVFSTAELNAISDGLKYEADLDPKEGPEFAVRVIVAENLLNEIDEIQRSRGGS